MHGICNRRPGLNARLLTLAFVGLAPGWAWAQPDAEQDPPKPIENNAFLRATPNPIVSPTGKGSTTIDWRCDSPDARVYLSVDGGAEQIFSSGMVGHQEVPWISAGPVYEFRLYEGAERTRRLASVAVTCSRTPSPPAPAGSTLPPTAAAGTKPPGATAGPTAPGSERSGAGVATGETAAPFIQATPNPIPAGSGKAVTTIRWRSASPAAHVFLSVDGGPEKTFSSGMNGKQDIDWINAGPAYAFHLYADADRSRRLASVIVTRSREAAPAATPAPPQPRPAQPQRATPPRQAPVPSQAAVSPRDTAADRGEQPAPEESFSVSTGIVLAALGIASVVVPFFVLRLFMIPGRRGSVAGGEKR